MHTQTDDGGDLERFQAIVRGCSLARYSGSPPDFSEPSLTDLLDLARAAAGLAEWPDAGATELQNAVRGQPPAASAWVESQLVERQASKTATLESLKEDKLDTWAEALRAEVSRRREQAPESEAQSIDQALAQIGFVVEHRPGSALRPSPRWDERPVQAAASTREKPPTWS